MLNLRNWKTLLRRIRSLALCRSQNVWNFTATTPSLLEGLRDREDDLHWTEFNRRYVPPLTATIRRMGFREDEAVDVAQETLMAFAESYRAGQYDPARGRLRSYLLGIARNRATDYRRRLRNHVLTPGGGQGLELAAMLPDEDAMKSLWEQEWHSHLLRICLELVRRDFEARTLQVFEQYALEGGDAKAIAEDFGVSVNEVHKIKSRVVARMRELRGQLERNWE